MQKEELDGLYTRQRCRISVPDPGAHGQYTVSVRPRREEKFIKSSDHSELLPPVCGFSGHDLSTVSPPKIQCSFCRGFLFVTFKEMHSSDQK